jgi:hypothetical protein
MQLTHSKIYEYETVEDLIEIIKDLPENVAVEMDRNGYMEVTEFIPRKARLRTVIN